MIAVAGSVAVGKSTFARVLQALLSNNVQAQMEIAGAAHALAAKSSGRVVVVQSPQTRLTH